MHLLLAGEVGGGSFRQRVEVVGAIAAAVIGVVLVVVGLVAG